MDHVQWMRVARRQAGVITRRQLIADGLTARQVEWLAKTGALKPLGQGVWHAAAAPATWESRLWHAVLATRGVLAMRTAAHLWRYADDPGDVVQVLIAPHRRVVAPPGVRLHRQPLPCRDVTTLLHLPVTTRRRSAMDYLASCAFTEAVAFGDRALSQGWLSMADLDARLNQRMVGNGMVRRVRSTLVVGAEAESERLLQKLLRSAGIGDWAGNYEVFERGRLIARVDVAFPATKLAIEVDGFRYHSKRDRFQRDRSKQNDLVALGWTVLRFTWTDLVERPGYVLATIRRQLFRGGYATA